MGKEHIAYFDFLRGVAILMVVGIHTFPECLWDNFNDILLILIRQLLNCAVPIFLALSAFFLARKSFDSFSKIKFWKRQIPKVYIPCLIWSFPLFLLSIRSGGEVLIKIVYWFIGGYSVYYFIALIIQYYILLPFLKEIDFKKWIITVVLSIVSISYYLYMGLQWPLILYVGPFWVWIMFFYQGILMEKYSRNYPIFIIVVLLLLSVVLQMIESYYLNTIRDTSFGVKASAFLYSSLVLWLLFSKKMQVLYERKKNLFFILIEYIGKLSFGIYLIHCYAISYINKLIDMESWGLKWLLTVIFSMVTIQIIKLLLPNKISSKYLGML